MEEAYKSRYTGSQIDENLSDVSQALEGVQALEVRAANIEQSVEEVATNQCKIYDLGEFARSGLGEAKAATLQYCANPNILLMKYTITGQGVAVIHQSVNEARSTQYLVLAGFWFTRYITFTNAQRTGISQVSQWWRTMPTNVDYDTNTHRVRLVDYNRQHSLPLNNANDGFVIPSASTTTDGLMSNRDKVKLDDIEAGAQRNPDVATPTANGLMSFEDKIFLGNIIPLLQGASANSSAYTDPQLVWKSYSRSNYASEKEMYAEINADIDALDLLSQAEGEKYNGWLIISIDGVKIRILHTVISWADHHSVDIAIGPVRALNGQIRIGLGEQVDFILTRFTSGGVHSTWSKIVGKNYYE